MATFQKFEEIISWQKARILNDKIGALIDNGSFKSNYRLINQIEGSASSTSALYAHQSLNVDA